MDFEFKTFSTRSFERFAQAMALHTLGPGTLIFGDGPDGAREATYEGSLNFPTDADRWSGYTVMQAKFLQVPGQAGDDAAWLVGQLEDELKKFTAPGNTLRKPEFYILVSNARLSPYPSSPQGKGGIAKIDEVFKRYSQKIGIKDYRVWHLDQLSAMLSGAPNIRRTYAAWLSSSDVIAELLDGLHSRSKLSRDAMFRYLNREIRAHRPIRLQQAGHASDSQTMIEDVFVDLPYRRAGDERDGSDPLLVQDLLERSRDRLDRASVTVQKDDAAGRPERILLLGGPGQGKSTISQYLAQIFRANILNTDRADAYPAEVAQIIVSTLEKANASGLGCDLPRRFPFRIELPHFADQLASAKKKGDKLSILLYVARHVSEISSSLVDIDFLRSWISSYPCLMILDGLDEVPPSANRKAVIDSINEFWDEAVDADLLMIVTTRPQGYNNDLDPDYYTSMEMRPLTPEMAVNYATKLAHLRLPEPLQRERVISRIKEAASGKATSRLMVSPLQVAILLALIDQRGDAPSDRWTLFDKYFGVVLEREQGKAGPVGDTMRRWSRQISALHHKAGFLLHVEAETQGNSEAYLTRDDFEVLIRGQLSDEEFEGEELAHVTKELLAASTERLVLLVQREEERYSFEVRSLQEFMAAAHLMTGREVAVQKRLRAIANRNHWIHVFQIAASKCFSATDSEQFRDTIITICDEINTDEDDVDRVLKAGSRLALALLDDGLAFDQPRYRRLLLRVALEILRTGGEPLSVSLTEHCEREPDRAAQALRPFLDGPATHAGSAWKLLFRCASKGSSWADSLLNELWPEDIGDALKLFSYQIDIPSRPALTARFNKIIEQIGPEDIVNLFREDTEGRHRSWLETASTTRPYIGLLGRVRPEELDIDIVVSGAETALSMRIIPLRLSSEREKMYDSLPATERWAAAGMLAQFHRDPKIETLARIVEELNGKLFFEAFSVLRSNFPWPVNTVFHFVELGCGAGVIASDIRAGRFGDTADWLAAEERWRSEGIQESDLNVIAAGVFFDAKVALVGAPWGSLSLTHGQKGGAWIDWLLQLGLAAQGYGKTYLRHAVAFIFGFYKSKKRLNIRDAMFVISSDDDDKSKRHVDASALTAIPISVLRNESILEDMDQRGKQGWVYLEHGRKWPDALSLLLRDNIQKYPGLLLTFASIAASARQVQQFINAIDISLLRLLTLSSHRPVMRCAHVLLMVSGEIDNKAIEDILAPGDSESHFSRPLLLKLVNLMNNENTERVLFSVAHVAIRNPNLLYRQFIPQIQAVADKRRSLMQQSHCWRELELGDTLLVQLDRRRSGRQ